MKKVKNPEDNYGLVFKMLAEKTLYETGLEFQFDKKYKDSRAVKNAVYKIYQKVLVDPQKYAVLPETVDKVKLVISERAIVKPQTTLREKMDENTNLDFKDLVLSGRKKAYSLLNLKMDSLLSKRKNLDEVSITALAQTFGILFDKGQIIQGEATENVALIAKIDTNMSPEDALASVLKIREINQADKDRKKK